MKINAAMSNVTVSVMDDSNENAGAIQTQLQQRAQSASSFGRG
jgi:hypothetical protein